MYSVVKCIHILAKDSDVPKVGFRIERKISFDTRHSEHDTNIIIIIVNIIIMTLLSSRHY